MIFTETALQGAFVIKLERHDDDRGFFARTFSLDDFRDHGLEPAVVEASSAYNHRAGTLRGLHFQFPPSAETKVVRCTRGSVLDVIVDLRPESATHLQHVAVELTAANGIALYVPRRFAHGYQTLEDKTEVAYLMGDRYDPDAASGIRHDEPALGIDWPLPVSLISDRDAAWPSLETVGAELEARMAPATGAARA